MKTYLNLCINLQTWVPCSRVTWNDKYSFTKAIPTTNITHTCSLLLNFDGLTLTIRPLYIVVGCDFFQKWVNEHQLLLSSYIFKTFENFLLLPPKMNASFSILKIIILRAATFTMHEIHSLELFLDIWIAFPNSSLN